MTKVLVTYITEKLKTMRRVYQVLVTYITEKLKTMRRVYQVLRHEVKTCSKVLGNILVEEK